MIKKGFTAAWQIKDLFARCVRRFARNSGWKRFRFVGKAYRLPDFNSHTCGRLAFAKCKALSSSFAFTLAEVLITLAIIGVVAALTIPTVVKNYRERQAVSTIKKVYSSLAQAIHKAQVENGEMASWDVSTPEKLLEILKPYLKITKNCGTQKGCFPDVKYKFLNGNVWGGVDDFTAAKAMLADGISIAFYGPGTNNNYNIWFDINGQKGPGQWGKDLFMVQMVPQKGKISPVPCQAGANTCNLGGNGWCCAAYIIEHDNMDYPK